MEDEPEDYTEPCECGHVYCVGTKYMQVDPFQDEINDYRTLYLMCDGDAYESAMDI